MRHAFVKPHAIGRINFTISHTRRSLSSYLVARYSCTSINIDCNFTQCFVFHTIRAKSPNQFIQFTHPLPHNDTLHVFIFFFQCGNIKIP